jgi:hypothetical protein
MSKGRKMDTTDTTNPAIGTAIKARPFVCTAEEVRGILGGTTTRLFRPVKAPKARVTNDGKPYGSMLYDLSRAWVDRGFPTDDGGEVLPAERWSGGTDPAPESAYREHYLHVPVAHPIDGWERNPSDDRLKRVYCSYGPGDRLWVREAWFHMPEDWVVYKADPGSEGFEGTPWRSPLHMPSWAARITLEITAVTPERPEEKGPWMWAITFKRLKP